MQTMTPITWFYVGAFAVLVLVTLRWFGVRRRVRQIQAVPHVEPVAGAPRYENRYEPPELVAATQEALNHRQLHGAWPPGMTTDDVLMIEHQLDRIERQRAKGEPVG